MRATPKTRPSVPVGARFFAISILALCSFGHLGPLRSSKSQAAAASAPPRVIEVTADRDSQYRIHGQSRPVITVTAGERLTLRITAIKAKSRNKDGSVHGFSLLRAKDHQPVTGWEFLLHPGLNEFAATAPEEPGDYLVVCTVICSEDHEQMNMKFVVLPGAKQIALANDRK
jgi:heme/copper-type cytochrome/quinol oxidase subunit 2